MTFTAHSTSIIDPGVKIGAGTKIWHWVHISGGAVIGCNVSIGQNVFVGKDVKIGNRCKIQNNVSVFERVCIEDDVFLGPNVVFTNVINPRAAIDRKFEYKDTLIKTGATLGANSTILCGIQVGDYAFVGAGAVVLRDVKPFALVVGVPAIQIGWMSKFGEKLPLPIEGHRTFKCPNTDDTYHLDGKHLRLE